MGAVQRGQSPHPFIVLFALLAVRRGDPTSHSRGAVSGQFMAREFREGAEARCVGRAVLGACLRAAPAQRLGLQYVSVTGDM